MDVNGRGIPTHCRCGERVRLLTSRTVKNPGRLFHSCPYGDELETLTIEKRTCEAVVYGLQKELQGFEKELQDWKMELSVGDGENMEAAMAFGTILVLW
ncbi:hypothetical protein IGI04_023418 [Brassica rapa subsp. trilocularis]|uniref:GRF-type domain-containing protein n=1 Tax=Brassica rapa subsp. trilocularis TaxID=1813537 RepID=A0ABQ7M547_BRACM|nr:hypothetical protein IGI04_023418 [Brassica rapa subsp. trilocularis]